MKLIGKKIIFGCDSRGDGQSPYLIRWTLLSCKLGAIYLHKFLRSDSDEHHDHPWAFVSLILWRGYLEETPFEVEREAESVDWTRYHELISISLRRKFTTKEQAEYEAMEAVAVRLDDTEGQPRPTRRVRPGALLFRKATHRHRVVLVDGKPAWSLVLRGPYVRDWGFFTSKGWQRWREYFAERGC